MKMQRRILFLLGIVTTMALAQAESVYIRMRMQVFESAAVFAKPVESAELAREGWLQQTDASNDVNVEMCVRATGVPEQKTQQRVQNQDAPGKGERPGHSRARLRQIGGRAELLIDSLEIKEEPIKDGQGKETGKKEEKRKTEQYSIPLEFASKRASWRDYEDGKPVEFRFTKEAIKALMARAKVQARENASANASGGGKASISIQVSRTKVPGRKASEFGRVTASKSRIDLIQIPTDVLVVLSASS